MLPLPARLRSLLDGMRRRDALNDDMDAEFRHHMELRAEDLRRSGLTPAAAARQARLEFGSPESFKDRGRTARGLGPFDSLRFSLLDLKLGGRMLVKHPGLTVIGTIAVAFAIAVGTVAFEVVMQVFFPTIPLPNGEAIIALRNWHVAANGPVGASRRDFSLWKHDLSTVTDLSAVTVQQSNIAVGAGAGEPLVVANVTASTFAMTRVPALRGRTLLAADERADATDVVVVGYEFWQNKLAGAEDVIGRVIRISGVPTTIVGVMPRGYAFPRANGVWRPLHLERLPEASPRLPFVFGRVASGHTLAQAQAEVSALGARSAAMFPETHRNLRLQVVTLPNAVLPLPSETRLILGSVNVFLVMLLALVCGNVALLLFARAASRQTEIVVRAALGASRGRIVMQLFAEALVLCTVGAAVGLIASNLLLRWLWVILEGQKGALPFWMGTSLSLTTMLYTIGLTLMAAAIAGILPALKVTSGGVDARLRAMSSGGGGLQFGGVWTGVIVTQIALTVVLPMVTSFMRGDVVRAREVPAGFAAHEYLMAGLGFDWLDGAAAGADTTPAARAARFESRYRVLADRLQAEPGVMGVTYANALPLMYHSPRTIELDPGPAAPHSEICVAAHCASSVSVDPRFFDVVDAPVVRGRSLTLADAEQTTRVVVVNETFVERVMGGHNPVGRQVRFLSAEGRLRVTDEKPGPWYQIVGVVPDLALADSTKDLTAPRIYRATTPKATNPLYLAVHVRGDAQRFTTRLRQVAASVDPALRVINPIPLPRALDEEADFLAFWYQLLAGVSSVALLLSLAGVYAVTAFAVARRTREIGVRVALGARPRQVLFAVFKRPFIQIALGVAVGGVMALTMILAGNSKPQLHEIGRPAIFVVAIGVSCMLACIVPTRRALRIQPTEALKDDG